MNDFFSKLPRFIQKYIYDNKWDGFREVQLNSFKVLFETDDHLLLSSGTSSGKTEAALFPVITSLYDDPAKTIGALYISPIKALINDQFERVSLLLSDSGVKVGSWHGDISKSKKDKICADPSGILQITPESLQSILANHSEVVYRLFHELRFVIIDEVHSFMNSDRGLQLLCEIESLERIAKCSPRRIGLSATLSDFSVAERWLKSNTGRSVSLVNCTFDVDYNIELKFQAIPKTDDVEYKRAMLSFFRTIADYTNPYNCIIFTNSRREAEKVSGNIAVINERDGIYKPIMTHHGSVSKEYRTAAESKLKDNDEACTVVSTSTLELGIDVGDLDRVIQINSPYSCSSFVQRMGRSGRRNKNPTMIMLCNDDKDYDVPGISVNLIRSISVIESYLKDHWIEPVVYSKKPFSLLYQQTLVYLKGALTTNVYFTDLVRDVLSMYPFRNITKDEYRTLIIHLIKTGHLCILKDNTLLLGEVGSSVANHMSFYSIFSTPKEYKVKFGGKEIGSVQEGSIFKDTLQLAGKSWKIVEISDETICVVPFEGVSDSYWKSGIPDTHTHLVQGMYDVLESEDIYEYLDESARSMLDVCRKNFHKDGLYIKFLKKAGGYVIRPWLGTIHFDTLVRVIKNIPNIEIISVMDPYCIQVSTTMGPDEICKNIESFKKLLNPLDLVMESDVRYGNVNWKKFDQYIPKELLMKEFAADRIDFSFNMSA